jgi:hypothetical protein
MNGNDMSRLKQYRVAERELTEAVSSVARKNGPGNQIGACPTVLDLRRFATGDCNQVQREELLNHLSSCNRCITLMRRMRERRVLTRRASLVLAVAAVLAVALWAKLDRSSPASSVVAMIDLRLASPTRGIDNEHSAAATARRNASRLRIILPIGSEGKYECQILGKGQNEPLLRASGEALLENQDVVLNVSLKPRRLTLGRYSLALRREGSEWVYYKLIVE